jgi:opacity protein-like surface antigen
MESTNMRLILAVAILLTASAAFGSEGVYLGGRFGAHSSDLELDDTLFGSCDTSCDLEFTDLAAGAYVGWNFVPWLGVEVSYNRLFEADDTIDDAFGDPVTFEVSGQSVGLHLRPILSAGKVDFYGRAGVEFFKAKGTLTYWEFVNDPASEISISDTEKSEEFSWGLGIQFRPQPNFAIGGEVSRIEDDDPVWIYTLSLTGYLDQK